MKRINEYKKGDMVHYVNKLYPIQDNGSGSLHIIFWDKGKRKKISLKKVLFGIFEPGSEQDYIFNGRQSEFNSLEDYQRAILL